MSEVESGKVTYRPGSGTALLADNCLVLLGPEVSRTIATALWPALKTAASLEELIDAVMEIGIRNLPTIAIAFRSGDETHLLLRGAARGAIGGVGSSPDQVLTAEARTWSEFTVTAPVQLFLGELEPGDGLPLSSGVVPADALLVDWTGNASDEPAGSDAVSGSGSESHGHATIEPTGLVAPVPPSPEGDGTPRASTLDDGYPDTTLSEPSVALLGGIVPVAPLEKPHRRSGPSDDGDPEEDGFDDLFGSTRLPLSVEDAAVRPVEQGTESGDQESEPTPGGVPEIDLDRIPTEPLRSPPAQGQEAGGFLPPRSRGPAVASTPPPPATGALIAGVPGMVAAPAAAPSAPPPATPAAPDRAVPTDPIPAPPTAMPGTGVLSPMDGDDVSSMTVSRASLGKRQRGADSSGSATGPSVQGIWCASGHPNPAMATACRSCGVPLDQVDAVTMPRPVLGVLRFSNGIEVELDRAVIVGRAPKAERISAREIPQLITLPSPDKDISRSHMEVRLDGWHVIVVDLGSTNGTVVTLPGQAPERLRPSEEQPISPGTVVTIAEEITFVYEVSE